METSILFPLGISGTEYVKSCLNDGGVLSKLILKFALGKGSAFSFLPANVTQTHALEFARGNVTSPRAAYASLFTQIAQLDVASSEFLIVIEDPWMKPDDPFPLRKNAFRSDGNVYYLLKKDDFDIAHLEATIKLTRSFLFVGVVAKIQLSDHDLRDHVLTENLLEKIARNSALIFVSAYDGEGLVIWKPE